MEASAGLVDRGYAIVSGAAYGIDGMAHRAALASQGNTVAVLAGGVDRFYPSGHDALLSRITESGAVISELPCGQAPTKWRFLQRNRIIAAVSRATVVVEAGWRSGALNTAGHAGSLGRPVGAVPGPVTSAASVGCHRLIREYSAVCVTTPDEMAELAPLEGATPLFNAGLAGGDARVDDATRLLDAMSLRAPRDAADLAARSGLSFAATRALLGTLELDGGVVERGSGWVRRARPT
jgi:DNA processing protein